MTRHSRLLHQWFPWTTSPFVVCAPMLGNTNAALAAAVTGAGGLGMLAGGMDFGNKTQLDNLGQELAKIRSTLKVPQADILPAGLGFMTFHSSAPDMPQAIASMVAERRPCLLWLFAPSDPSPHGAIIPKLKQHLQDLVPPKIAVQVGSVAAARDAARDGADIIVAQGVDAGGHQFAKGVSLISLVPEIQDMLSREFPDRDIPLLAAGGIVDGRGAASALALGADGIVMGTRFVVSKEAPAKDDIKQVYVDTVDGGTSTAKSTLFDDVRGTGYWPRMYDGRGIVGNSYKDLQAGMSMEEAQNKYKEAVAAGDTLSRAIIWSGTGVGSIREVKSAGDIVRDTQAQTKRILQGLSVDSKL